MKNNSFDDEVRAVWSEGSDEEFTNRALSELSSMKDVVAPAELKGKLRNLSEPKGMQNWLPKLSGALVPALVVFLAISYRTDFAANDSQIRNEQEAYASYEELFLSEEQFFIEDEFDLLDDELAFLEDVI